MILLVVGYFRWPRNLNVLHFTLFMVMEEIIKLPHIMPLLSFPFGLHKRLEKRTHKSHAHVSVRMRTTTPTPNVWTPGRV